MLSGIRWQRMAAVALLAIVCGAGPALAQRQRAPQAQAARDLGPAEVQRLFDAYAAMEAQTALVLDEDQFSRFLPRLKALQDTRRRVELERQRVTGDLARMTAKAQSPDEAGLRERLKALQDLTARAAADTRSAYDALDQVLDVRQQARFRVFELQMERRKFELMLRARRAQAARTPREDH